MQKEKKLLAVDFGASSGRVMKGCYDGKRVQISQVHRFSNDPVWLFGTMHWDFLRLIHEMKNGIKKACQAGKISSIGVDTWGVDFGLLDREGNLIENPVHYRDERTRGMIRQVFEKISAEELYGITGNQIMEINTVFQLLALKSRHPDVLGRGEKLLMMSDLFNYYLSGSVCAEYTAASTTQLLDARRKEWSTEVISRLELPEKIFQPIVMLGTELGNLCSAVCRELSIAPTKVVAVAGHDTQCALAAVPACQEDFIFVSCGTWSLFGTELSEPEINKQSAEFNLTNEGAYGGKISLLKNIVGLWLLQESRRQWSREGKEFDFAVLEELAEREKGKRSFIDPDALLFMQAGDIPNKIRNYCGESGQPVPETVGQIVRCIHESLALKYRKTLEEIEMCTGKKYGRIYMVGGGSQSRLLCQLIADVCGMSVCAGPVEATVYGNVLIQLSAMREVEGLAQMRSLVADSGETTVYEPEKKESWDEIYAYFKSEILGRE